MKVTILMLLLTEIRFVIAHGLLKETVAIKNFIDSRTKTAKSTFVRRGKKEVCEAIMPTHSKHVPHELHSHRR